MTVVNVLYWCVKTTHPTTENTRTEIEKIYIENFNKCKEVNKTRQLFYNKHKNLIDKFSRDNFKNAIERVNAIEKLHPREQNIIDTYDSYFQNYFNDLMELDADIKGIKDATEYKQESGYTLSRPIKTERNSFGSNKKRNLGTNSWDSIEQGEYSAKPSEYRQVDAPKRQDELKIENATRDSLYKWYGEVGKARYDVDKELNHFNKITKATAKDFKNRARNTGEFYAKDFKNEDRYIHRRRGSLYGITSQRNMGTLGRLFFG